MPNDDQLLWDDDEDARSPERPAAKGRPRRSDDDVVAELADDGEEGGNLLWILSGAGTALAVLALIAALLPWGTGDQPEVATTPFPPVTVNPSPPDNPFPPVNPPPINPPPVVPPKPPAPVPIGLIPRPEDPAAVGRRIDVRVGARQPLDHAPTKLVFAAKHGLLVTMDERHARVYDPLLGQVVTTLTAKEKFNDLALTPDESAVLVADYGGERNVTGKDGQHRVHRFTFATATAATTKVAGVAHSIVAPTPDRFVIGSSDQWTEATLNAWPEKGDTAEEVVKFSTGRESPLAFDPFGGRLLHHLMHTSQRTARFVWDRSLSPEAPRDYNQLTNFGPLVLATDGVYGYQGKTQFESEKPATAVRTFPERIVAAARDVAFGESGRWYRVDDAQLVHQLPFKPRAVALARDGKGGWAVDGAGDLHALEIREVVGAYVPPPAESPATEEAPPAPAFAPPANPFSAGVALRATASPSVKPSRQSALWVGYAEATNTAYVQATGEVIPLDGTTGEPRPVAGGPRLARATALAPDKSALFSFDGLMFRLDVAKGQWTSFALPDWGDRFDKGGSEGLRFVPVSGDTVVAFKSRLAQPGRLIAVRWDGTTARTLATADLDVQDLYHLGYDPATGYLLVAWKDKTNVLFQRAWLDGAKFRMGTPITVPDKNLYLDRLVVSATGGFAYVGPYRLSVKDGKAGQVDYGGKVVAAAHDWVLTDKGEFRDAVTGKGRGELGEAKLRAAAFAPDGRTVWVANNRTEVNRYALAADAGGVAVKPPLAADDWSPTVVERPKLAAAPGTQTALTRTAVGAEGVFNVGELLYSDTDERLVAALGNGRVLVFDGKTLKKLDTAGGPTAVVEMSMAPDRSVLFASEKDKLYRLDLATLRWTVRDNPFGGRIAAVGEDRLLASDGPTKSVLTLVKWGTDGLVPTARAELPGPADLLRYDPATATAFVFGRDPSLAYFTRVAVVKGKLVAAEKKRLAAPFNGGRLVGRLPLTWDGSWILGDYAVNTADGTVSMVPGALPGDAIGASRDLVFCRQAVLANGKPLRPAAYSNGSHVAVSPNGNVVFVLDGSELCRFTLSAAAPVVAAPKGKIEEFKPTLFPRPVPPAAPPTRFAEVAARDVAAPADFTAVLYSDRHSAVVATTKGGVTLQEAATGKALPGTAPPNGDRLRLAALAPDQSALFAVGPDGLHRYDFAAKKWESRPVRGGRAIPLDGTTVLLTALVGTTAPAEVVRWTADGVSVLGTAHLPANSTYAYDPATGSLYVGVRGAPGTRSQLRKYPLGGKPFAAEWSINLPGSAATTPVLVLAADGKRVFAGTDAFDAATGKPAGDPFPEAIRFAAHGFVLSSTGKLYHPDTGKELAALPHATIPGSVASDGKSAVFLDRAGGKLRRYDITAGAAVTPMPKEPKNPPVVIPPKEPKNSPLADWKPPVRIRPDLPDAAGTLTKFVELQTLPCELKSPQPMAYSSKHDLLVADDRFYGAKIWDLKTSKAVANPDGVTRLMATSLSPDETAVFATGSGTRRLDTATRTWEPAKAVPGFTALDGHTVLHRELGKGETTFKLFPWADRPVPLLSFKGPGRVEQFLYDAPTGDIVVIASDPPRKNLIRYAFDGKGYVEKWSVELRSRDADSHVHPSWDGKQYFFGCDAYAVGDGKRTTDLFKQNVRGVTRDAVIGQFGSLYHPDTGKEIGKLPHSADAAAVSFDGRSVVVQALGEKKYFRYSVTAGAVAPPPK